jgi:hypothetical protein
MMILTTEAGTEIELAEDCCGWYATHDGITYHLYFNGEDSREVVR